MKLQEKQQKAQGRKRRVRQRLLNEAGRPRLNIYRSHEHIYAQIIDDTEGKTMAAASTHELKAEGTKTEQATAVGELIAKKAKEQKITKVAFDRGAYKYHGRVKALAEAARKAGLEL